MHVKYLIYTLMNDGISRELPNDGSGFTLLAPSAYNVSRFAKSYPPFLAWWLFHWSGVFYNNNFTMVVCLKNDQIVHRTCVFPGFYKFPFMGKEDLQVGDIWTRHDYRNKGMATNAVKYVLSLDQYKNRKFWYVVEANNRESVKLAERSGFAACGAAHKKNRMGISFIGKYEIENLKNLKDR